MMLFHVLHDALSRLLLPRIASRASIMLTHLASSHVTSYCLAVAHTASCCLIQLHVVTCCLMHIHSCSFMISLSVSFVVITLQRYIYLLESNFTPSHCHKRRNFDFDDAIYFIFMFRTISFIGKQFYCSDANKITNRLYYTASISRLR